MIDVQQFGSLTKIGARFRGGIFVTRACCWLLVMKHVAGKRLFSYCLTLLEKRREVETE